MSNRLFPVFLKLEQLNVLLVGGGYVALEKLSALLSNAPDARITLVAREIGAELHTLSRLYGHIQLHERAFNETDLDGIDLVMVAINDPEESARISALARTRGKLVNAADKPALCDFYLGSIVQKGDLKLAISTNGKSPTMAKRLREMLDDCLPSELDELIGQMNRIREQIQGDFSSKVLILNELTRSLIQDI